MLSGKRFSIPDKIPEKKISDTDRIINELKNQNKYFYFNNNYFSKKDFLFQSNILTVAPGARVEIIDYRPEGIPGAIEAFLFIFDGIAPLPGQISIELLFSGQFVPYQNIFPNINPANYTQVEADFFIPFYGTANERFKYIVTNNTGAVIFNCGLTWRGFFLTDEREIVK